MHGKGEDKDEPIPVTNRLQSEERTFELILMKQNFLLQLNYVNSPPISLRLVQK